MICGQVNTDNQIMEKHRAFWRGQCGLVRRRPYVPAGPLKIVLLNTRSGQADEECPVAPDMLDSSGLPDLEPGLQGTNGVMPVEGDSFVVKAPLKFPWTEAILGCPIKLLRSSGCFWVEHCALGVDDLSRRQWRADNPWLLKLVEMMATLVKNSPGKYCPTHATLRGPIDMADALLGTENLLVMLVQDQRKASAMLELCADIFVKTVKAQWAVAPPIHGGYVNRYGVWAPGLVVRSQTDASAMISPDLFRSIVLPHDLRVLSSFPFSLIHTHSAYLHILDGFLERDNVPAAVQVGIDEPPFGPEIAGLISVFKRVLERKPLIIHGVVTEQEADLLGRVLPKRGLFLDLMIKNGK